MSKEIVSCVWGHSNETESDIHEKRDVLLASEIQQYILSFCNKCYSTLKHLQNNEVQTSGLKVIH